MTAATNIVFLQTYKTEADKIEKTARNKRKKVMEIDHLKVQEAKRGDVSAFAVLYQAMYPDLYRFALYTLKNTSDAEDAVSEAVTDAFASIRKLKKADAFRGWIFRILYYKCKDKLKEYTKKTVELPADYAEHAISAGMEESVIVRTLFFKLREEERLIISMHLFAGYTSKEIAKLLKLNENTVRSKESRALKKLAALAEESLERKGEG